MSAIYCEGCWEITDSPITFAVASHVLFRGHYECAPRTLREAAELGPPPPPIMSASRGPIIYSRPDPWVRP